MIRVIRPRREDLVGKRESDGFLVRRCADGIGLPARYGDVSGHVDRDLLEYPVMGAGRYFLQ